MSLHAARATGDDARTFRKSAGIRCTTPPGISFLDEGLDDTDILILAALSL